MSSRGKGKIKFKEKLPRLLRYRVPLEDDKGFTGR